MKNANKKQSTFNGNTINKTTVQSLSKKSQGYIRKYLTKAGFSLPESKNIILTFGEMSIQAFTAYIDKYTCKISRN